MNVIYDMAGGAQLLLMLGEDFRFSSLQDTVMEDFMAIPLPKYVNPNVQSVIDLRLPHDNPFLASGPLLEVRDDILRVISFGGFACADWVEWMWQDFDCVFGC